MARRCGSSAGPKACSFIKNLPGADGVPPVASLRPLVATPGCPPGAPCFCATLCRASSGQGWNLRAPRFQHVSTRGPLKFHLTGLEVSSLSIPFQLKSTSKSLQEDTCRLSKTNPPSFRGIPWPSPSCQSMVVQFTSAGKRRARLQRPSPTGEKHSDMCRFFRTREM